MISNTFYSNEGNSHTNNQTPEVSDKSGNFTSDTKFNVFFDDCDRYSFANPKLKSIANCFKLFQDDHQYKLYAVSLKYHEISENNKKTKKKINKNFKEILCEKFIPCQLFEDKDWMSKEECRDIQPIVHVFTIDHKSGKYSVLDILERHKIKEEITKELYHEAIFAVHESHEELMDNLIGKNTLNHFSTSIKSSSVERCNQNWIFHAGRNFSDYEHNNLYNGPYNFSTLDFLTNTRYQLPVSFKKLPPPENQSTSGLNNNHIHFEIKSREITVTVDCPRVLFQSLRHMMCKLFK